MKSVSSKLTSLVSNLGQAAVKFLQAGEVQDRTSSLANAHVPKRNGSSKRSGFHLFPLYTHMKRVPQETHLACQEINSVDESGEGIKMAVTKQSSAEARQLHDLPRGLFHKPGRRVCSAVPSLIMVTPHQIDKEKDNQERERKRERESRGESEREKEREKGRRSELQSIALIFLKLHTGFAGCTGSL